MFVRGHHPRRLDILPFLVKALEDGENRVKSDSFFGGFPGGLFVVVEVHGVGSLPDLLVVWLGRLVQEFGSVFRASIDKGHYLFYL